MIRELYYRRALTALTYCQAQKPRKFIECYEKLLQARIICVPTDSMQLQGPDVTDEWIADDTSLIALPFQTVFFESTSETGLFQNKITEIDGSAPYMMGLLAHEQAPGDYLFCFFNQGSALAHDVEIAISDKTISTYRSLKAVTEILCRTLHESRMVTEKVHQKIKLKPPGGEKRHHRIREVIRICSRKEYAAKKLSPLFGGHVDFSHRWEVSGHFRKITGIGKDRAGSYIVHGYTWVKEHERGPDGKPLIKKTRVLIPSQEAAKGD